MLIACLFSLIDKADSGVGIIAFYYKEWIILRVIIWYIVILP
jgi:hypothetical protein